MTTQTITIVVNEQGARVVQRNIEGIGDSAQKSSKGVNTLKEALSGFASVFAVGALFTRFIHNTFELENAQAQLRAVLESTGNAAGFTVKQLNNLASAMAQKSIFGSEEITNAQTRLLSYTGVVGKNFPRAMQIVIDQSARLKISLAQSAETIGRALESPTKAAEALSRQGFGAAFTQSVRNSIKELVNAGKTAEAQAKVMQILEESYKGAALAARNTLAGALTNLKGKFDDLFRLENTTTLTTAINLLADNLLILVKILSIAATAWAAYWVAVNLGAWTTVATAIIGNAVAFIQLAATVRTAAGAMALLNAVFLANPIGLVVAAVGAAIAAFVLWRNEVLKFADTVIGIFRGIGQVIVDFTQPAVDAVKNFVSKAWEFLTDLVTGIGGIFEGMSTAITDFFNYIGDKFSNFGQYIKDKLAGSETLKAVEEAGFSMAASFDKGFKAAQENGLLKKFGKPEGEAAAPDFGIGSSTNGAGAISDEVFNRQQKLLEKIIGPAKDYKETIADLNALLKDGSINFEQYNQALANNREQFLKSQEPTTFAAGYEKQLELMKLKTRNVMGEIGEQVAEVLGPDGTLAKGIGEATANAIVFGESWTKAIKKVAASVLQDLASSFAKAGVKQLFGSLGGGGGGSGIFSSFISKIPSFFGFDAGGFTGNVGRKQIAGVVHGQEYVVNADATRRNLPLLQSLNNGGGIPSNGRGMSVNIQNQISGADYEVRQVSEDQVEIIARRIVQNEAAGVVASDIANPNSRTSKSLGKYTRASRRRQ